MTSVAFLGTVIEWRGPAPFYFLAVPDAFYGEVREAARVASYGWGCVPVRACIGDHAFTTSLMPRDGGYLLPLKAAVRAATGLVSGDEVNATLTINDG